MFDKDGEANNGCEAGCADVTGGSCDTCTSTEASGCTKVTCEETWTPLEDGSGGHQLMAIDKNKDPTDGCEVAGELPDYGTGSKDSKATPSPSNSNINDKLNSNQESAATEARISIVFVVSSFLLVATTALL